MQKLKEDIKQRIIEVGKLRFKKEGYENTSMKDIASDVGISTGNIYRYFLTKKHLLNEILKELEVEIENFFNNLPSNYEDIKSHEIFDLLIEMTVNIAETKGDTLKVMVKCENENQFLKFKSKVLDMFISKMFEIVKSIKKGNIDITLCEAMARAQFEGFVFIVKSNIDNIEILKKNLIIYEKLMIENLGERVLEVIKNDRKVI